MGISHIYTTNQKSRKTLEISQHHTRNNMKDRIVELAAVSVAALGSSLPFDAIPKYGRRGYSSDRVYRQKKTSKRQHRTGKR